MKAIAMCVFLVACGGGVAMPEPPVESTDSGHIDFPSTEPITKEAGSVDSHYTDPHACPGPGMCTTIGEEICSSKHLYRCESTGWWSGNELPEAGCVPTCIEP